MVYEALVVHEATGSGIAELAGAAAQVQTLQKAVFLRKSCEGLNGDCLGVEISAEPEPSLEPPSVVCNMAGGPFSADACLNFFDAAACEDFRISEKPGVLPGRDPHERAADGAADPESGSSCVVAACLLQQLLSADLPRPPEQAQVEEPRIVEAPALARLRTLGGGDSGAAVITQPATQALRNQALRRRFTLGVAGPCDEVELRPLDTAYVKAEEQPLIAACVADEVQPLDAACVKAEEQPLEAADLVRMEARVNDLDRQIASAMLGERVAGAAGRGAVLGRSAAGESSCRVQGQSRGAASAPPKLSTG